MRCLFSLSILFLTVVTQLADLLLRHEQYEYLPMGGPLIS